MKTNHCYKLSHPDVLGAFGMLDGAMVDHRIMGKTLAMLMEHWDRTNLRGRDFPEAAMCVAHLGDGPHRGEVLKLGSAFIVEVGFYVSFVGGLTAGVCGPGGGRSGNVEPACGGVAKGGLGVVRQVKR